MPPEFTLPPMLFTRFTQEFAEIDWSMVVNGPFELTDTLQSMLKEAGAKGMALAVQAALVDLAPLMGAGEEDEGEQPNA